MTKYTYDYSFCYAQTSSFHLRELVFLPSSWKSVALGKASSEFIKSRNQLEAMGGNDWG